MKRFSLIGMTLLLSGCYESRITSIEQRTRAITLVNERLETLQNQAIEHAIASLQKDAEALAQQHAALASELHMLRRHLVAVWHGDPTLLATRLRKSGIPESLRPPLQAAQANAGNATKEQRFRLAMEGGTANDLGAALDHWEDNAGFSPDGVSSARPPGRKATPCKIARVEAVCRVIPSEENPPVPRALCTGPKSSAKEGATLIAVETGQPVLRDFAVLDARVKSVVRAFPGGWLVRLEFDKPVERFTGNSIAPIAARSWFAFLRFVGHKVRPGLHAEIAERGPQPMLVDLDADGNEEVLVLTDPPRVLHYDSKDGDMKVRPADEYCVVPGAAKLSSLHTICRTAGKQRSSTSTSPTGTTG